MRNCLDTLATYPRSQDGRRHAGRHVTPGARYFLLAVLLSCMGVACLVYYSPQYSLSHSHRLATASETRLNQVSTFTPIAVLDDPPPPPTPSDQKTLRDLAWVSRHFAPAVMLVGNPRVGSGAAFVISRRHRLLVTNAHVADICREAGDLLVVANGSHRTYRLDRVFRHPDYERTRSDGVLVTARGHRGIYRGNLGPDVAILQLGPEDVDLPEEFSLVGPEVPPPDPGTPVGLLGFYGSDPPEGEAAIALYKVGAVSAVSEFTAPWDPLRRWTLIDTTTRSNLGDSGGPVFLQNGRVVAVCAWARALGNVNPPRDRFGSCIGIKAVWETLRYHHLDHLIDSN